MEARVKVFFELAPDADGYPPVAAESVWATRHPSIDACVLDNIPFFTREATLGDLVSVRLRDGVLWFEQLLKPSENSLVRAVLFEPERTAEVRQAINGMGSETEFDGVHRLIAINVPATASLPVLQSWLERASRAGLLDYEEPILRQ